jgi:hypothetical protein
MKESRDRNYFVKVTPAEGALNSSFGALMPDSYVIDVNNVIQIAVLPWFPDRPWPPQYPEDLDDFSSRDALARHALATLDVVFAPANGEQEQVLTVVFPESPETTHTVFQISQVKYEALLDDLRRMFREPAPTRGYRRLDELAGRPIAELLEKYLPRASLSEYVRQALSLL